MMTYNGNSNFLEITLSKNIDVSSKLKDYFNSFGLIKSGIELIKSLRNK